MSAERVVSLHACACGSAGRFRTLELKGVEAGKVLVCDGCLAESDRRLAQVRPVFEAMLGAGIRHDIANRAMTVLLNLMAEGPASRG